MSQHDHIIDNAAGATVRADINNALAAIATCNSGSSAPSTTYAYMLWADTANALLKQRNAANSAWETIAPLPVKAVYAGTALTMNPYATNTTQSQAHGLGQQPDFLTGYIECLSTNLNYSAGIRIHLGGLNNGDRGAANENGFIIGTDATNTTVITAATSGPAILDASSL